MIRLDLLKIWNFIISKIAWIKIWSVPGTQGSLYPSSTHQFNRKGPVLFSPKIPHFHTKSPLVQHPSVQHQKTLNSTRKTPQFHTENPSVQHQKSPRFKKKVFGVGQKGFFVGPKGFFLWNWGFFGVELRGVGCWKGVFLVLNCCVELRRSVWNWTVLGTRFLTFSRYPIPS